MRPGPAWSHFPTRERRPPRAITSLGIAFTIFLIACLAAGWLSIRGLAGFGFAAGAIVAAGSVRRQDLISVVIAPPGLFLIAVLGAELIAAHLDSTPLTPVSAAASGVLTLSDAAPWLFGGVIAALILAMVRGLPECVRQLRADLAGDQSGDLDPDEDDEPEAAATGGNDRWRLARGAARAARRR